MERRIDIVGDRIYSGDMSGVQFVVDEKGAKTAVVIDLKRHRVLREDFYDGLVASQRASEPRESLRAVRRRLIRSGKIRG